MDPAERIRRAKCETCFDCNGSCPLGDVLDSVEEMMDGGRTAELDEALAERLKPLEFAAYRGMVRVYQLPCEPREREVG